MNDEGVAAILGLVLLTQDNWQVRMPKSMLDDGLPEGCGISVFEEGDEIVVAIAKVSE